MWFVKTTEALSWEFGALEMANNQDWKLRPLAKFINIYPGGSVDVTGQTQKRHPLQE